eukprot:11164606-Lingulodinium_polyedra.AAC.1
MPRLVWFRRRVPPAGLPRPVTRAVPFACGFAVVPCRWARSVWRRARRRLSCCCCCGARCCCRRRRPCQ